MTTPQAALLEALKAIVREFPTDSDMDQAGWEAHAIKRACDAYDNARAAIAQAEAAQPVEPGFAFQVDSEYETQAGEKVRVIGRTTVYGAECLECSDGMYRYDRKGNSADAGRVTGTAHDYSFLGNFKRPAAPQPAEAAPKQEAVAEVRESAPVDPTGRTVKAAFLLDCSLPAGTPAFSRPQQPAPEPVDLQALNVAIAGALMQERERLCAAIKAEDDYSVTQGDYMLDSDDCISVIRGTWKRPDFSAAPQTPAAEMGGDRADPGEVVGLAEVNPPAGPPPALPPTASQPSSQPSLPPQRDRDCDAVDACVFSSDMLHDDEQRAAFKAYLGRWNRAVGEHEPQSPTQALRALVAEIRTGRFPSHPKPGPDWFARLYAAVDALEVV